MCRAACVAVLALLLLCIMAGSSVFTQQAFADEPATQEDVDAGNAVNVQQRPDSSFIYDTSIDDLAVADSYYDGQTVQVTGEAVGDNIRAGLFDGHSWITLESEGGRSYISVYLSDEQAGRIDEFGEYGVTGTTLQIQGTYHLACQEHDGLSDLHAEVVSVVAPGAANPDEFEPRSFAFGALLVAVGLVLTGTYYYLRERQR